MPMVPVKYIDALSESKGGLVLGCGFLIAGRTASDYENGRSSIDASGPSEQSDLLDMFWDADAIYPASREGINLRSNAPDGKYLFLKRKPGGFWKAHDVVVSSAEEKIEVVIRVRISHGAANVSPGDRVTVEGASSPGFSGFIQEVVSSTPQSIRDGKRALGAFIEKFGVDPEPLGGWTLTPGAEPPAAPSVAQSTMTHQETIKPVNLPPPPPTPPPPHPGSAIDASDSDIVKYIRASSRREEQLDGGKEIHTAERRKSRIKRPLSRGARG